MDTLKNAANEKADVAQLLSALKTSMPKTYAMIVESAKTRAGVYAQVRRGLQGESGCFFARERIRLAGKLEQWFVAGNRSGFEDILPDQYHKNFDDFVEVVCFLPVQAPAQNQGVTHAN
jgi:hypothetical protein